MLLTFIFFGENARNNVKPKFYRRFKKNLPPPAKTYPTIAHAYDGVSCKIISRFHQQDLSI